jgi:hypothetical protein
MGIEYKFRFSFSDIRQVEQVLDSITSFSRFDARYGFYEFRNAAGASVIPDVHVRIETYGLYVCDNGGAGREIIADLSQQVARAFGEVVSEEL